MSTHYVYRHFSADDTLLYIGCTKDPDARWARHRSASHWASDVALIALEGPYPRSEAFEIERKAIAYECPLHNRNSVRLRPSPEPQVALSALRAALGLTLDAVCARVTEVTGRPFTRGALSALENGHRGASQPILDALCVAYGLRPGDINTTYIPRDRKSVA